MNSSKRYKWEVLFLLWIAFFLNQADRQIFNVVLPSIKADMHLTDVEIGLIATVFNLVFALFVPISGILGNSWSKKWIIIFSIILWSGATMLTGISSTLLMFILFRSTATGLGEAMFGPANYSLLAGYHKETRAFAMSIHQTAYYVGIIASGFLAGYIAENWGWRNAFYVFGAVGVVHGIYMIFRLKDKKSEPTTDEEKPKLSEAILILFKTPTALILTIAFSGLIFVLVGYLTWTPTYLYENFSLSLSQAGLMSMLFTHVAAFAGIFFAGKISDRLAERYPQKRMLLQAIGLLSAIPFILLVGQSTTLLPVYIGLAGFGFARAFFDANTYSVLFDVIPEKYHSSASGMMQMIGFSVGSLSPLVLGYLKPQIGLGSGISLLSVVWLVCSIILFVGYRKFYKKDFEKLQLTLKK